MECLNEVIEMMQLIKLNLSYVNFKYRKNSITVGYFRWPDTLAAPPRCHGAHWRVAVHSDNRHLWCHWIVDGWIAAVAILLQRILCYRDHYRTSHLASLVCSLCLRLVPLQILLWKTAPSLWTENAQFMIIYSWKSELSTDTHSVNRNQHRISWWIPDILSTWQLDQRELANCHQCYSWRRGRCPLSLIALGRERFRPILRIQFRTTFQLKQI